MSTRAGEPTAALYGFSSLLLKLLREENPSAIAFARDLSAPTFRHQSYAAYKANRPPMPEDLKPQWKRLDQLIDALAVPSHSVSGFEADDVLATLAAKLGATENVSIVSGDRDLFQTITNRVSVLFVGARGQEPSVVDENVVQKKYGVTPKRMPFWSALVGETADNLEGVAGIGAKTATKLVTTYETAEKLVQNLDQVMPLKTREALRAASDRLLKNEILATLHTDLELPSPLAAPVTPASLQRARELFVELEFKSLVTRVDALRSKTSQLALF